MANGPDLTTWTKLYYHRVCIYDCVPIGVYEVDNVTLPELAAANQISVNKISFGYGSWFDERGISINVTLKWLKRSLP